MLGFFFHITPDSWGTFGVAIMVALIGWRIDKRGKRIEIIVNGRYEALVARTVQLEDEMRALGVEPPPDPAIHPSNDTVKG